MIYLIQHLALWLAATAAFAGLAGWAWFGLRARPQVEAAVLERDRLMRDLTSINVENGAAPGVSAELEREMDALRRRADLAQSRVTDFERAAEAARSRADEASGRVAELERALERVDHESEELTRLREEASAAAVQSKRTLDVEVSPVAADDEAAIHSWRLRYFEQRVRYLESQAHAAPLVIAAPARAADESASLQTEWRAREAEARARHLEQELRDAQAAAQAAPAPAIATEGDDLAPRWRMAYLEKRVAYLQEQAGEAAPPVQRVSDEDADRWKWRARFLEARVRHLDAKLMASPPVEAIVAAVPVAQPIAAAPDAVEETPAPLVPAGAEERPLALPAARNGAPDDLSLIGGVSLLQQSTLNSLGIYHFDQIAAWSPANVAWVDQYLRLRGRIGRERWLEQADALARGGVPVRRFEEEDA